MPQAQPTPGKKLLSPADHTLIMIDHQSQMSFATKSIDAVLLRNNCALVAKAAREFKVPTILTTVAEKTFSGPIYEEIRSVFPKVEVIDRTTMNTWEDARIAKRVNEIGWARSETYAKTTGIARAHGGAYGLGVIYAKTMFAASEGH